MFCVLKLVKKHTCIRPCFQSRFLRILERFWLDFGCQNGGAEVGQKPIFRSWPPSASPWPPWASFWPPLGFSWSPLGLLVCPFWVPLASLWRPRGPPWPPFRLHFASLLPSHGLSLACVNIPWPALDFPFVFIGFQWFSMLWQ